MSVTEILNELPKLSDEERHLLLERLNELEMAKLPEGFEETPEMLAAIDEGIRSLEEHGCIPLETVMARLRACLESHNGPRRSEEHSCPPGWGAFGFGLRSSLLTYLSIDTLVARALPKGKIPANAAPF